jgi:hypothetical protein
LRTQRWVGRSGVNGGPNINIPLSIHPARSTNSKHEAFKRSASP